MAGELHVVRNSASVIVGSHKGRTPEGIPEVPQSPKNANLLLHALPFRGNIRAGSSCIGGTNWEHRPAKAGPTR